MRINQILFVMYQLNAVFRTVNRYAIVKPFTQELLLGEMRA